MGNRSNINLVGNTTFGENVGTGTGVYKGKNLGNVLQLKTLSVTGTTMSITTDADNIYFSAATGGGGGGTITGGANGLSTSGSNIVLGGALTGNTCIDGNGEFYSLSLTGMSQMNLMAQSTVYTCGCNSVLVVGGGICICGGGFTYMCNLPSGTQSNVAYVAADGRLYCGAAGGGGGLSATGNGISDDGTTIRLGGTLTGDTSIDMNNKDLFILDADNCGLVVSTTGATTCVVLGDWDTFGNNVCIEEGSLSAWMTSKMNGCYGTLCVSAWNTSMCHNNSGNTEIRYVCLDDIGTRFGSSDNAGNNSTMYLYDGSMLVTGANTGGFAGIRYGGDYSDNYVARSIPDAAWVTGQTGGGGVAVSGVTDTSVTTYINASGDLCAQPNLKFNGTTLAIAANMAFCSGADRYITISNTTSAPSRHLLICAQQYHGFETSGDVSGGRVCLCGGFGNNTSESGGSGTGGDAHIFGGTGKIHTGSATGGDVLICGGWGWVTTSGTGTGGTVHLCGGDGDTIGRIRLSGLPSKVSETCVVWIDASGNLSTATPASDSRLKCCVTPISSATSMLSGICGYSAEFNNLSNCEGCCEYVFLAQEVEKELPLAVKNGVIINEVDYKKIEYDQLIPVMWNIIKEQEARIQALESK